MNEKQLLLTLVSDFKEYAEDKKTLQTVFDHLDELRNSFLKLNAEKVEDEEKIRVCISMFALLMNAFVDVTKE